MNSISRDNPLSEILTMQQRLSQEALERARATISRTFYDPTSFEELGGLAYQLEKQLSIVEGQLNSAVQTKLDSLKRAVDLMDESVIKLSKVSTNIQKIDEKITNTNTAISNYNNLKKVHNAKENLTKVIDQVEFFAHVPEKVEQLHQLLHEKPLSLKEVFLEATKLESLRAALMKEIRVSRNRRYSVTGSTTGDYSEETSRIVYDAIDRHLKIVPALTKELRDILFSNVDRMFELAEQSPDLLVMTFEIIEMQQEYNDRRNNQLIKKKELLKQQQQQQQANEQQRNPSDVRGGGMAKNRTVKFNTVADDVIPSTTINNLATSTNTSNNTKVELYENITGVVEGRIRKLIDEINEQELSNYLSYLNEMNNSHATVIRWIGTQILTKMKYFQTTVLPCIPGHYDVMFIFLQSFDIYILPKLQEIMKTLTTLKVSEILDLISWYEFLHSSIIDFGFTSNYNTLIEYNNMKNELSIEYKERIKLQIHTWFNNIKKQELEITKSTDNILISSNPEDMFNIIHAQLNVAKEKLPPEYIKEVAIACLQVLQDVQRQSYDSLIHNYHTMEAEVLCAIINDHQRMEEKCREFSDDIMKYLDSKDYNNNNDNSNDRDILEAITNEVATEYLLISNQGVLSLARCIMDVLDEEIFSKLFTVEWEQQTISGNSSNNSDTSSSLMATLVITVQDYLEDLSNWLTYYHYTKLVKEILLLIVGHYIMSIRKRANGVFTFTNELIVANKIIKDRTILYDYFIKLKEVLQRGGLRTLKRPPITTTASTTGSGDFALEQALNEALEPMYSFARIVSCHSLSGCENDCKELFSRYGIDGLKVVQGCFLSNPCINRNDRAGYIDTCKKLFDDSNVNGTTYSTQPLVDYANYDTAITVTNIQREASQKRTGGFFWGSKKK